MDKDEVWHSWVQKEDPPKDQGPTWETVFWVLAGWMMTILILGYFLSNNT